MTAQATCYTVEAALNKAIELETSIFKQFLTAISTVRNPGAKEILKEAAENELGHKQQMELALLAGNMDATAMDQEVSIMDLDHRIGVETISADADYRTALAHAIHLVNTSVNFYHVMATACQGAPMGPLFTRIGNEQKQHLQRLEDSYEEHCMTEN